MADSFLTIELTPKFIQGNKGALFTLSYLPEDKAAEVLVFLPAFAEELNRCRVMVAMQARRLAELGVGSLLLDCFGTGDSDGEFGEANWPQWLEDTGAAIAWLKAQGYHNIGLWGIRLGALLAADMANRAPGAFSRLLLWQPVLDGDKYLTQFLRIRMSFLMERGGGQETTEQIRNLLQQGHGVEIAGYQLSPHLAEEIAAKRWSDFNNLTGLPVHWYEWVFDESADLPPASQKTVNELLAKGVLVTTYPFSGASFWQAHERELTPSLLNLTTELFL